MEIVSHGCWTDISLQDNYAFRGSLVILSYCSKWIFSSSQTAKEKTAICVFATASALKGGSGVSWMIGVCSKLTPYPSHIPSHLKSILEQKSFYLSLPSEIANLTLVPYLVLVASEANSIEARSPGLLQSAKMITCYILISPDKDKVLQSISIWYAGKSGQGTKIIVRCRAVTYPFSQLERKIVQKTNRVEKRKVVGACGDGRYPSVLVKSRESTASREAKAPNSESLSIFLSHCFRFLYVSRSTEAVLL